MVGLCELPVVLTEWHRLVLSLPGLCNTTISEKFYEGMFGDAGQRMSQLLAVLDIWLLKGILKCHCERFANFGLYFSWLLVVPVSIVLSMSELVTTAKSSSPDMIWLWASCSMSTLLYSSLSNPLVQSSESTTLFWLLVIVHVLPDRRCSFHYILCCLGKAYIDSCGDETWEWISYNEDSPLLFILFWGG